MTAATESRHKKNLERKVAGFLRSKAPRERKLAAFLDEVSLRCDGFIVGGLLRDLLILGRRGFRSDVDLVVRGLSFSEFEHWMGGLRAKRNRFGGYAVDLGLIKTELWLLDRTWAHVEGHQEVRAPHDLFRTTFFDWDSVLYSLRESSIIADQGYFARVHGRVLDIRLKENPNPLGNAVRALRYAVKYDAALSSRLVSHVAREIRGGDWGALLQYEERSFGTCYLQYFSHDAVVRLLSHDRSAVSHPFQFHCSKQLNLY